MRSGGNAISDARTGKAKEHGQHCTDGTALYCPLKKNEFLHWNEREFSVTEVRAWPPKFLMRDSFRTPCASAGQKTCFPIS